MDRQRPDPWAGLVHQTAWVFVGNLDTERDEWITQLHHRTKQRASSLSAIPRPDDLLEVTADMELPIVAYQQTGEDQRLASLAGRIRTTNDRTGIVLMPGSLILVKEVAIEVSSNPTNRMRGVWLRVVPGFDI